MMEENNKPPHGPVPKPRVRNLLKTPVPLPRSTTTVGSISEDEMSNEEGRIKDKSKLDKSFKLDHTNSLRKSLRKVTNNVQERSTAVLMSAKNNVQERGTAVLMSAKNVSSRMESSVRNILSKRHTLTEVPEMKSPELESDVEYVRCGGSLPCDDVFRDISFNSPLSSEAGEDVGSVYSEPPAYPPPPPPDSSHYDELRHSRPGSDMSPTEENSIYEEIHGMGAISQAASSTHSSSVEEKTLNRCDSWNYYDIPFTLSKPRGHSYENVAIDYLPTEAAENIYSDEPAKSKIYNKPILFPSETASVCSSKESYENWNPASASSVPRRPSPPARSEKSFATKSVIYEFDPLFMDRQLKKWNIQQGELAEGSRVVAGTSSTPQPPPLPPLQKCLTAPTNLNRVSPEGEATETDRGAAEGGEYFLYQKGGASKGLLSEEEPQEIPVLTESSGGTSGCKKKSSLVRWDSMKSALRKVTDSAPWSPILTRRNQSSKGKDDVSSKVVKMSPVHSGFLLKSPSNGEKPKDFQVRWCQLSDGKMTLAQDKTTTNKESIRLESILSIQALLETKQNSGGETVYCWEMNTVGRAKPYTLGCGSLTEARLWMRSLLESITNVFPVALTAEFKRAGQAFIKEGVSSAWSGGWVLLLNRTLHYCQVEGQLREIDLRKARCIVLADGEGQCSEGPSESGSYIKLHALDDVLYLQMDSSRETKSWYTSVKSSALENGTAIHEQQLTKDYVPVIVDKCINFVYAHGSMSEGIYRRSGGSSKVAHLLSQLRRDAWEVQISRQDYTEYDVSTVLKRFFRDLPEPLLTASLHKYFCNVASVKCSSSEKETMYRNYLDKLPQVNYLTLRRLIGHLHFLQLLSDRNRMPVENLAAIWAPTLMHVEGKDGMEYTKKEVEVISELIQNYKSVFQVEAEETDREERIRAALERVSESSLPPPARPSGDLKIAIYIHSKRGEPIIVPVNPSTQSGKVCLGLACRTDYSPYELCLSESVLGGSLWRPLHHSESLFDVVLSWAYWDTADSRDNALILSHNTLYKELLPLTKHPISKSGELKYADRKAKSFKNFMFEFSQAKLQCYKDKACSNKLNEWKIEDISWYIGHEAKRNPQTRWAITFIEKKDPPSRSKEQPYFGHTLAGGSKEESLQWMAALLLGQYQQSDLFIKNIPIL